MLPVTTGRQDPRSAARFPPPWPFRVVRFTAATGPGKAGPSRVEFVSITVRNAAREGPLRRAVSLDRASFVFGQRIWISDDQSPAMGYVVGAYGAQRGGLGTGRGGRPARHVHPGEPVPVAATVVRA